MRESGIEGLSANEIRKKYSLSYLPEYVSDVDVPQETTMRVGTLEANFGGERGATQFELIDDIPDDNFKNTRSLPE